LTVPAFRRVAERPLYQAHVWRAAAVTIEGPGGEHFEREIVFSPGAVAVVPVLFDAEGTPAVVLVRQYRGALDADLLEIPAGMRDVDGEDPAATASRELIEEAGFAAEHLERLCSFYNAAGMTDSLTHVFVGTGLAPAPRDLHGPEEQEMEVVQIALADAMAMIERGEITDAKTMVGLLMVDRKLGQGRSASAR
jgi:8-oxo-dGTP pyrophosphatase MutT (NUDIX family)